jgi:hypothetical protein
MPTILKTKNSVTTTVVPTTLQQGELAVNITDKKLWVGNAATTPVQLLGGGADGSFTNISVSSVATFGAGTVSAPSITTTGDTNTGIFFPAADTIAFAEGGAEVARFNADAQFVAAAGTASLPVITTTGDVNTGIFFPAADTIAFSDGGVESVRITDTGNVGVGTSSPASKLDVNGTLTATSVNSQNTFGFKNRIINGAMVIDQRNAGASVTVTGLNYALDRWFGEGSQSSKFTIQQNAGSVTPPAGFTNYLGATSSAATSLGPTDYFILQQRIEGFNFADLGWGTASAKTVTLSFQVYSSLTGTFGGAFLNNANNRSYPFSYSIPVANTWTTISITIAGDTTGTWLTTNGTGLKVIFSLGTGSTYSGTAGAWAGSLLLSVTGATSVVGTDGATFYITGVQLEKGSTATSFDYRPFGTELALCQRYYYRITVPNSPQIFGESANADSATSGDVRGHFPITMRTYPTALEQSGTASHYIIRTGGVDRVLSAVPTYNNLTTADTWRVITTVSSGQTAGLAGVMYSNSASAYLGWSSEL